MKSIGEALVDHLTARDVDLVFGIPGVHTVELYRGLASSGIRHITPRHEQGAGFMADGYARVSGKPGVALVITGPGVTNILTPMAQARADSVPMLVLSGVNRLDSLGRQLGHLHELPDQRAVAAGVALNSERVEKPGDLDPAMARAFHHVASGRPGPVHIEIPLDVAKQTIDTPATRAASIPRPDIDTHQLQAAVDLLVKAKSPVILAGGGLHGVDTALRPLAERLDAPVVLTTNARGMMHGHPLAVPASPSLEAVRNLIAGADAILALGTELGPTDYDMYSRGFTPDLRDMIRVDICPMQLERHEAALKICTDAAAFAEALLHALPGRNPNNGPARAEMARRAAFEEIGPEMRTLTGLLETMRDTLPGALMIGDSTQIIYAGNLYYDHDRPGGWFNAATGYGALGYAIPAAIGAALAKPECPVLCLAGDGGAQFTLPELMVAAQENLPIIFVIWNNQGYREIASAMAEDGVAEIGCDPAPPDFAAIAKACSLPFLRCGTAPADVGRVLAEAAGTPGPVLVEIDLKSDGGGLSEVVQSMSVA